MLRRSIALAVLLVAGCARDFQPLVFKPPVPLQDPLPGKAIVYLLRTPHEPYGLRVFINKSEVAVLPSETYSAISLSAGRYEVLALPLSAALVMDATYQPTSFEVKENERRFLYTAQPTDSSSALTLASIGVFGLAAAVMPIRNPAGPQVWTECSELDAQGLMSNSRYVRATQDEL